MLDSFKNIYIKTTPKRGKAVFAKRNFRKGEFIFLIAGPIVTKPSIYTVPIDKKLYIKPLSLYGKELNHSCQPNCGIKYRVAVTAMRQINKNEEISIDYAMIVRKYSNKLLKQNIKCHCGVKNCRGEFGSYVKLSPSLRKKYKGFISDYLTK